MQTVFQIVTYCCNCQCAAELSYLPKLFIFARTVMFARTVHIRQDSSYYAEAHLLELLICAQDSLSDYQVPGQRDVSTDHILGPEPGPVSRCTTPCSVS